MASLSSILNSTSDSTRWQPTASDATPAVDGDPYPSPPAHNPPVVSIEDVDFESLFQDSIQKGGFLEFGNGDIPQNLDVAALYDMQDGVRHWADDQAQDKNNESPRLDNSTDGTRESLDVEMMDGSEGLSSSDDEMDDNDADKVCYGMVCCGDTTTKASWLAAEYTDTEIALPTRCQSLAAVHG